VIPEESIQAVLAATDIVAVIGRYVPLKRVGRDFKGLCPFHNEKSPSFAVSPAKSAYHCFGCGAGGGVIRFLTEMEHISFPDAVRRLAETCGVTIIEVEETGEVAEASRRRRELFTLHADVCEWFHQLLLKHPSAEAARAYWKGRGLTGVEARNWRIGYAPPGTEAIISWAKERRYSPQAMVDAGLLMFSDDAGRANRPWFRFAGRLMFPICNEQDEVIGFSGRVLEKDAKAAKYMNSPETPIFDKGRTFFGFNKSKRPILKAQRAIICEGQMDLIACYEAGVTNIVAPLGTAFTEHHARMLKRLDAEVILCYDGDTAGQKAASRAFRELAKVGLHVRVAELPVGEDPDSFLRKNGTAAFQSVLEAAPGFFDFQATRLASATVAGSTRDKIRAAEEIATSIAYVSGKTAQEDALLRAATQIGVAPEELRRLVSRAAKDQARTGQRESEDSQSSFRSREGASESEKPEEPPIILSHKTLRLLCQLMLADAPARAWLIATGEGEMLEEVAESELLSLLWAGSYDLAEPASLMTFLAQQEPRVQNACAALMAEPIPSHGAADAEAAWNYLRLQRVKSQIDQLQGKLQQRTIAPAEALAATQAIKQLQQTLNAMRKQSAPAAT
jgi:DNA primase